MVAIPKQEKRTTLAKINSKDVTGVGRHYVGMSGIGEKCHRKLQYDSRNAYLKRIPARVQRIFNRGHEAEHYMVADLRSAGLTVWDCLEEQTECVGFGGHWMGHPDGKVKGVIEAPKTTHLLEMKTHNDKSFKHVAKETISSAIALASHKVVLDYLSSMRLKHFAQTMRYMGAEGLKRGLYVAYGKNDSQYYIERIYFNQEYYDSLIKKESDVLLHEVLYERIGTGKATWVECKFCDAREVCFGVIAPLHHCRTCENSDLCMDGEWKCAIDNDKKLDFEQQMRGCEMFRLDPFMKG